MSKSGRFLSMPESTMAIVGIRCPSAGLLSQRGLTPDAVVHRCLDVGSTVPLSFTGASYVTVRPGNRASLRIFLALSVTATECTN